MPEVTVFGIKLEVNLDQAAKFKVLQDEVKATNQALVDGFKSGDISAGEFNQRIAESDSQLREYAKATQTANGLTEQHGDAHGTLASKIGASRQQLGAFIQAAGQASGANENVTQSVGLLASGLGPLGIALGLSAVALKVSAENAVAYKNAQEELIAVNLRAGKSIEQTTQALQEQAQLQQGKVFLWADQYRALAQAAHDAAIAQAEGAGNAARMADYAEAMKKVEAETLAAGVAMYHAGDAANFADNNVKAFAGDFDALAASIYAANGPLRQFGETANNIRAAGQIDPWEAQLGSIRAATQAQDKYWSDLEAGKRKAALESEQAQRKAAAEAKTMAEAQTKLTTERTAVEKVAGAQAAATFDTIVAHAGDAADAVALVKMWENTLPPEISQQINILVAAHLDPFLAGLLGGKLPRMSTGHQQGDERDFTLGGEDQSVRLDYERRYGQTAAANDAWRRDHLKELAAKGVDITGYASGGYASGPQLAVVGDSPGGEFMVPANRVGEFFDAYQRGDVGNGSGGRIGTQNVYVLNLVPQKSPSNTLQDFNTLKALAGAS